MGSPSEKKPIIPQRAYKANPVMQTRDAATKRRRDMFFKRVQNGREDKKWEARGEQVIIFMVPRAPNQYLRWFRFNSSTLHLSANAGKLRKRVKHHQKSRRLMN